MLDCFFGHPSSPKSPKMKFIFHMKREFIYLWFSSALFFSFYFMFLIFSLIFMSMRMKDMLVFFCVHVPQRNPFDGHVGFFFGVHVPHGAAAHSATAMRHIGSQRASECIGFLETRLESCKTVNRQCSSGLQAVADVAAAIKARFYDIGIAAGLESMTTNPMAWEGSINLKFEKNSN